MNTHPLRPIVVRGRLPLIVLVLLGLAGASSAVRAASRNLVIDRAHSSITIESHGALVSLAGALVEFQPEISIAVGPPTIAEARITFAFADITTGHPTWDREMQQWQDNAHYPTGSFHLDSLRRAAHGRWNAQGVLELHGVRRAISFPVALTQDAERIAIDGEVTLDVRDYGLVAPKKFVVLRLSPTVKVCFHLQGRLSVP